MSTGKKPIVAVIEPDPREREVLRRYLQVLIPGADQLHFESLVEALRGLRSYPPHLVLVDRTQAELLLTAFPKDRRRFHVLVLAETAGQETQDFERIKALGADDVCAKPLNELLLKAKIETLLFGLYASPFSFFADGSGTGLSAISMTFPTKIYALNEEAVEFVSPVHLQEGHEILLGIGHEAIRVRIIHCKPNPNRADSHFVRGEFPTDTPASERAKIRRLIAQALFRSVQAAAV